MPRFAANLSWLWTEFDFERRFQAARAAGFDFVETQYPAGTEAARLRRILSEAGVELVMVNQPRGTDPRGLLGLTVTQVQSLRKALALADALGTRRVHLRPGFALARGDDESAHSVALANLAAAAAEAAPSGVTLLLEPINRKDHPGAYPSTTPQAVALLLAITAPNLALQIDTYHMAMSGEDGFAVLRDNLPLIGHVQVADHPGRHEPGTGTLELGRFLRELDAVGYTGFVGLEYQPSADTDASLSWLVSGGFGGTLRVSRP